VVAVPSLRPASAFGFSIADVEDASNSAARLNPKQ